LPSASLPRRVYARTPAKLNLFLELLSKRSDGYHEIETIMTAVSCYDTLRVDRSDRDDEIRLKTDWFPSPQYWRKTLGEASAALLTIPDDDTNLIWRSIARMRGAFGITSGFKVFARKRAPAGAGMGGASSDAAATILAVAALSGIDRRAPELAQVGAELGSDVPFFLGTQIAQTSGADVSKPDFSHSRTSPQAALATGRGEFLTPFALAKRLWFVVAYPPLALSTAAVYRVCKIPQSPVSAKEVCDCLTAKDNRWSNFTSMNRLSQAAQSLSPMIGGLLSLLSECCRSPAMMTGSGSACFCVCPDRDSANKGAEELCRRWSKTGESGHVMVLKSVSAFPQLRACW
jgi:4-diphosphocytidyl-2-C-methyl-D-erythritol kinase